MIGTYDIRKMSVPCFDDKCYILDDGTESMAHLHRDINLNSRDNLP